MGERLVRLTVVAHRRGVDDRRQRTVRDRSEQVELLPDRLRGAGAPWQPDDDVRTVGHVHPPHRVGREMGPEGVEAYLETRTVVMPPSTP
jgi:hypothetical protein